MSYTNPTGSAIYTYEGTTLANVNIGLSTPETGDFYAQHLLIASGGKVKQNIRVSNGGILENAVIDYYGASVGSGGLISNAFLSGAAASRTTFYVYSGGVASRITMVDSAYISTVLGATLADVIVSGGYFTANGATVTNVTLEKPLHINTTTLAALGGATVTSVTINNGTFTLTGATATSVTVNAGTFSVSSGGTASYINVAGTGNLVVNSGGTAVTLAGNVVTSATVMGGGYLSLNNSAVVSNIDVRPGGRLGPWAGSIISGGKIVGGTVATQPEVYGTIRDVELYSIDGKAAGANSAWLRLAGNGSAVNMRISSGGKFQVNSGTAEYTTVYSAGYIVAYGLGGNTIVNHTVISSGGLGSVYAGAGKKAPVTSDTWVLSGASLNLGVSGAAVDLMVNPGAILTLNDATASASVDEHPWLDKSCITAVEGATVNYQRLHNVYYGTDDESIGLVSRGGAISGATVEAGYSAVAYQGVALTDVNVADGGKLVLKDYAYVMGGSANSVAAGNIYLGNNATADTLGIVGSQLTGLTLASNTDNSHLSQVTLLSGLTATNATMLYGGTFYISNGGGINGLEAVAGTVNVYNGGVVANATISGATTANRGFLYLREAGAVANNVTLLDNAYASNYHATANDLTISGGYFTANGMTINGATLDKFQNASNGTTLDAISGTTVSNATVNYGTLVLRTGAFASDTTINGGVLNVSGGDAKASGAVLLAGTVSVGAGASLSGAIVRGGAFYAYGIASDVTISNGGVFSAYKNGDGTTAAGQKIIVSSGGKAYAQTSDAIISDITVYNGGTVTLWSASVNGGSIAGSAVLWGGGKLNDAEIGVGGHVAVNGGAIASSINATGGAVTVSNAGAASDVTVVSGTVNVVNGGVIADATFSGAAESNRGILNMNGANAVANNVTLLDYAYASAYGATINDLTIYGGYFTVNGATVNGATLDKYRNVGTGTTLNAIGGATVNGVTINAGKLNVRGESEVFDVNALDGIVNVEEGTVHATEGAMLTNLRTFAGTTVDYASGAANNSGAMIRGQKTTVAAGTLVYQNNELDATVTDGVMTNLGNNGKNFRMRVGTGITVEGAVLHNGDRLYAHENAEVEGGTINAGGNIGILGTAIGTGVVTYGSYNLFESGSVYSTTVESGGLLRFNAATTTAIGTTVKSGGTIRFINGVGGRIDDTTLMAGATLELYDGADTGDKLTFAFDNAAAAMNVDLSKLTGSTTLYATGVEAVGTYALGSAGTFTGVTQKWGLYENALVNGGTWDDALNEVTYTFNGTALTTTALTIKSGAAAGLSGDNYTALRTNDRAAKWTEAADDATLVTENFSGDAYLVVAGDAAKAIYGAGVDFAGTVNIDAKSGTIRNLAAGAEAGKTVGAVKLTFEGATLDGAGYAGGFGTVTGKTETLIEDGSFSKDFYAGALANYKNTGVVTTAGDVSLEIADGEFSGNIYGAASVKAGAATSLVHSVGDVTIEVKGGETTKGNQACLFAGGYATGTAASDTAVYTVGDIDVTIDGGSWGTAAGGRGIFGGAFASQVTASAQNVSITINGGSFGNVYGGGWAQKGGKSIVGNVDIDITGGTIANVFGGGTHSVDGAKGTTVVDDVTINVSGGSITGAIYAGGQLDGDTVAGDVISVSFTGHTNFGCGVYGYSYGGGAIGDAALSFSAYTGTFSGKIGGFVGITLDDDTAMTLSTAAADVSNGAWEFDFTDRADTLADTSLLTWGSADFAGDTVRVNFADADQAAAGWSIATAAFDATTTFTLAINGTDITTVAYDTAIEGGAWDGWKFTDENGTLKFKQLA